MALNLNKLIKAHQFRFETENLGELLCHNFSSSVMSEAGQWLKNRESKNSEEFVRHLAMFLCQPVNKEESVRINKDQAESLTQSEIAEFSRLFIGKNKYLLEDKEKRETIRKKDDDGRIVVSFKDYISEELLKMDDESDTDHLLRVIDVYIAQSNKRTKKLFKSATKGLFSSSTLGLLKENQRLSDSLGASLIPLEPLTLPKIPENPVFETNRQLASFGKELNEAAALIKNMNDLGVQMAVDSAAATARSKFWNNIMFGLGLITLTVTAILSYLSYTSTNDSSNQVERLLIEQNSLLKIQEENQKSLIEAISSLPPLLERGIAQGEGEEKMLYEISTQLKNITNGSKATRKKPPRALP
ncbi:MAG: hypothetical protein KUG82_21315 [Pseudomonadales bacterium]|nr:hypothetical protein [Pseudomonadales bacterium]